MKKIYILLSINFLFLLMFADGGYQFLYLDSDPTTLARGEASGVFSNNFFKNPANSSNPKKFYLYANHAEYFLNIRYENIGFILPTSKGSFAIDLRGLYTDNMVKTDSGGISFPPEEFKYFIYIFDLNYSKTLSFMKIGSNVKFLTTMADEYSSGGIIFDFGSILFVDKDYNIGISISNIAVGLGYMPLLIKVSPGYKFGNFKFVIDANYYVNDNSMFELGLGTEYNLRNILLLRFGYIYNSMNSSYSDNFRGGLSLCFGPVGVNYASAYFDNLGLTHYVGMHYDYARAEERNEKLKEKVLKALEEKLHEKEVMMSNMFLNKAKDDLAEKKYNDALENIDIALIWDPENTEAELLKGMVEKNKKDWEISSLIDKGMDKYMSEDYVNAMQIFNEVLKIDSTNEQGKKYYEKAKLAYNKKIKSSQKKSELDKGINYYSKGNYLKAKEIFSSIYKETQSEKSKKYLDMTNAKISEYIDKKISELEKQLKKNNFNYIIKTGKKLLKYKTEQSKINSLISKAEINKKAYIDSWLNKAISQYNAKNYKKAEEFFQRVIVVDTLNKTASEYLKKIKSKNIYSSEDIGELYLKGIEAYTNNNYKLAIKYWEQCLDINPNYKKASKNIEKAKKKLNELENL